VLLLDVGVQDFGHVYPEDGVHELLVVFVFLVLTLKIILVRWLVVQKKMAHRHVRVKLPKKCFTLRSSK